MCSSPTWHDAQPSSLEGLLAGVGVGRADVAAGGHGEGARVEGDLVELVVVELGVAAVGRAEALGLQPGARLRRAAGDDVMPMSPAKAPAFCSSTVGTAAFQPKRPSTWSPGVVGSGTRLARPEMPSPSSSSGSAQAEDVVLRHGLEQADAEHRRRDPRRDEQVVDRLAVGPDHLVVRRDERVRRCRRRRCRAPRCVVIRSVPSDRDAADGAVLELVAEVAVRASGCRRRRARSAGSAGPRSGSSASAGGWARPSRKWHDEHDWALKSGPSPSRPSVDDGAVTQLSLKKLLPTAKVAALLAVEARHRLGEGAVAGDLDGGVAALVGQLGWSVGGADDGVGRRRRRSTRASRTSGGGRHGPASGRPPHRVPLDLQADRVAEVAGQRRRRRRPGPGGW